LWYVSLGPLGMGALYRGSGTDRIFLLCQKKEEYEDERLCASVARKTFRRHSGTYAELSLHIRPARRCSYIPCSRDSRDCKRLCACARAGIKQCFHRFFCYCTVDLHSADRIDVWSAKRILSYQQDKYMGFRCSDRGHTGFWPHMVYLQ